MMALVECRGVSVRFGDVAALECVDLDVERGESVAILGPSGSGKSTLLHALAGFIDIDDGSIGVGGETVSSPTVTTAPDQRSVGFVFQSYALWPHLTALATVAYPMRRAGMRRRQAEEAARELLENVGVGDLSGRKPAEMSGGQQQRVGLARALARDAELYLFDEPTAHLDAGLRSAIHEEIERRRTSSGAAAIYATHDAAEALAVADRVAVLRSGRIVQTGTPTEIYEQPIDVWVAELTGRASVLEGNVFAAVAGGVEVELGGSRIAVEGEGAVGQTVQVLVRPEWVRIHEFDEPGSLRAEVIETWYRGPHTDYRLATAAGHLECRTDGPPTLGIGRVVHCAIERGWLARA